MLIKAMWTAVVAATFQQGHLAGAEDGLADQGYILLKQLVLKVSRSSGDHYPRITEEGWHQIGEGLANTGAGFNDSSEIASAINSAMAS